MKTITFYSYKGGVGRSLALSNIAIRLSELNKKVCVLDFDLEAPGLNYKFEDFSPVRLDRKGVVDYIYEYTNNGILNHNISGFIQTIKSNNNSLSPIYFFPAGNTDDDEYWKKLSCIDWSNLFYSEGGKGVRFFLDMQAKIEKEINPDFLLVDSRTGISELSGITIRLWADDIVILAANNKENIYGSEKIIKNLYNKDKNILRKSPRIHFVITRLPFPEGRENLIEVNKLELHKIITDIGNRMKSITKDSNFETLLIRSDGRLEVSERKLIGIEHDDDRQSISSDYLKLFDVITKGYLLPEDIINFKNTKKSEQLYNKLSFEKSPANKIKLLETITSLNPNNSDYFLELGCWQFDIGNISEATKSFKRAIKINPGNEIANYNLGLCFKKLNNLDRAKKIWEATIKKSPKYQPPYRSLSDLYENYGDYDKAIDLLITANSFSESSIIYNQLAHIYRKIGDLDKAKSHILLALELDPKNPILFGTLSEIYADMGNIEDFYIYLNLALANDIKAKHLNTAKDAYLRFRKDPKFIQLLERYNVDLDEVFEDIQSI